MKDFLLFQLNKKKNRKSNNKQSQKEFNNNLYQISISKYIIWKCN